MTSCSNRPAGLWRSSGGATTTYSCIRPLYNDNVHMPLECCCGVPNAESVLLQAPIVPTQHVSNRTSI